MSEQEVMEIKEMARTEYGQAKQWLGENPPVMGTVEENAADVAAARVMYRLGMHDYAVFQGHIGGKDVKTWLLCGE